MIRAHAEVGFEIPLPVHPKTGKPVAMEVSMPPAVMRAYQQAYQAHPNAVNLPPMRIVERGTWEHLKALCATTPSVVYIKEDPQNPTIIDEKAPEILRVLCQGKVPQQS